jgi:hypothetical protein
MLDELAFKDMQIEMLKKDLASQRVEAEAKLALERHRADNVRIELEAKLILQRQEAEAQRALEREEAAHRQTATNLLAEQSKLHMRGLIELFEKQFSKNPSFIQIMNESSNTKIDRKTKWGIMLDLEEYSDLRSDLLEDFYDTNAICTQVNALLDTLNHIAHSPLKDVLDPSSSASLVINRLSIGNIQAQLLKCIAKKCNILHMIIPS